jgi:putative peptidoglycan lipid II flippase
VAALSPLVTSLVVVASLLVLGPSFGIFALAFGTVGGAVLEILLLLAALRAGSIPLDLPTRSLSPYLRDLSRQFARASAGAVLMASTYLVDQAMAALLSPGSVAALNYANRFITLPLGLTAAALGTAVLPYFSAMVARRAWHELHATTRHYLWLIFLTTVPVALALIGFAMPLTEVLFARGSFTTEDVPTVAATIAAFAVQIPFYTAALLLVRLAAALKLNAAVAAISAVNLVVDIVFNYWLSSFMGVAGIALSTSIVYMCSFMLLYRLVRRALAHQAGTAAPISP